ncbi:hypothetical protein MRB53_025563 [Persea americana]|uniref:Uncharacterized protein n=1 Tax=Persea americana TaxID=3435 RepID=A0ACC2LFT3_PERAE|nr:hypothetical protein MRB53_025563 [Persea americana]
MCPIRQSAIIHLEPESWPFSEEQLRCKHAFQFIEATGKENITERIRSYESPLLNPYHLFFLSHLPKQKKKEEEEGADNKTLKSWILCLWDFFNQRRPIDMIMTD